MTNVRKQDNSSLGAKLELRRMLLDEAGGPVRVLDCYAGRRAIWDRLRQEYEVSAYLALDQKRLGGTTIKIDNLRWLTTAPLPFDVIDLDAYGEPWGQYEAIITRRDLPPAVTVFLTVGQGMGTLGQISKAALRLAGIPEDWNRQVPRESPRFRTWLTRLALQAATSHGWTFAAAIEAETRKTTVRYIGLRLERIRRKK